MVHHLALTRRDAFLNDAQVRLCQQMPAVASSSPVVVPGRFGGNWYRHGSDYCLVRCATTRTRVPSFLLNLFGILGSKAFAANEMVRKGSQDG